MIKHIKSKKARDKSGLFIIEGEKFINEIPKNYTITQYIFSQKYASTNDLSPYKSKAQCEIIRDSIFQQIADTVTPQGIIAVCEKINHRLESILQNNPFILMGENINDPGNVGTLIRTAAAAGVNGVIFTQGSCDVYSPKVVRSSAGAVLRIPIIQNVDPKEIFASLSLASVSVFAADPVGDFLPYDIDMRENLCILIGNESHGLSDLARTSSTKLISLPMQNDTESLNASVAGSILLYEAVRQRLS